MQPGVGMGPLAEIRAAARLGLAQDVASASTASLRVLPPPKTKFPPSSSQPQPPPFSAKRSGHPVASPRKLVGAGGGGAAAGAVMQLQLPGPVAAAAASGLRGAEAAAFGRGYAEAAAELTAMVRGALGGALATRQRALVEVAMTQRLREQVGGPAGAVR
jgi:hypothetical protein